jgi:hypothetical protein
MTRYKSRNTFNNGKVQYVRGRVYDSIEKGEEGMFVAFEEKVEKAEAKPVQEVRKKRRRK